jgi:uncharacterized protein with FMN-binding domain
MSHKLKIILIVILLLGLGGFLSFQKLNNDLEHLKDDQFEPLNPSQWTDGVYLGEASQLPIKVIVELNIQDQRITKLTLLEHQTGEGQSAEAILDHVLNAQSLAVDVITGATYSSVLILKAIENALEKAVE